MCQIRKLPTSVVNKIAAGEVIERPASVVKELMENAIDAGAGRIDVALESGGTTLVRIADDGRGIPDSQLLLAVASHATSKIRDAEDLFQVRTLGFRGEALASIAAISQFRLRSRVAEQAAGAELEVNGGQASDVSPCGCPVGTTVEVANLFCNTPVRRKFLKTTQTELGHAAEAFTRLALSHPEIHFTLRHNDRVLHDLPPADRWRDRITTFFGQELSESLIWVESCDGDVRLSGYVADPQFSRANNRLQYLFLNGRHIRDRSLQHALGEAYRGLLMTGRHPIVFLRLELPAESVDVNVHPTKLEVRFQDGGRLYSQLLSALRNRFLTSDLTARAQPSTAGDWTPGHDPQEALRNRRDVVGWARGDAAGQDPRLQQGEMDLQFERRPWDSGAPLAAAASPPQPSPVPGGAGRDVQSPLPAARPTPDAGGPPATDAAATLPTASTQLGARGVQLHNRYLVTEDDVGIVVIDQHALHERILYEQLRTKVLDGELESQRLLVPEPVSLSPAEAAAAWEARQALSRLGIQIEPFGGDTLLVTGYPAMLSNLAPGEVLRQAVDLLLSGGQGPQARDLLDELLHMVSCKAAVKAGDRLSSEEIATLLDQRHLCQDAHHCPHGRPTALVFSRDELDKRFKRT